MPAAGIIATAATPWIAASTSLAIPVVGPIIAGVFLAISLILGRKGPKQKEATAQMANELEAELQKNLAGYMAGPRTDVNQAAALRNFDLAWAWLSGPEGCGNPAMGEPGRRCIAEREAGGSAPWCPTDTGCDWFILYRDPIALDTVVQTSALGGGSGFPGLPDFPGLPALPAGLGGGSGLLVAGALALGVFLVLRS
jgi:hypothetical protein